MSKRRRHKSVKPAGYWTQARVLSVAKKFTHRSDFKRQANSAWSAARRLGVYDQAVAHMSLKPNFKKWTKDTVIKEAQKFNYLADFRRERAGAYDAALRLRIIDELRAFLGKKINQTKWSKKLIHKAAKHFKTRTQFARGNGGAYRAAQKLKVLDEVCAHMETFSKPAGYWTKKLILKEAKKHKSRTSFLRSAPGAWKSAKNLNILEEAYAHMERVGSKYERAIYAIEFSDKSVYVGLTFNFETRYKEHLSDNRLIKKKTRELDHRFVKFEEWYSKEVAAIKEAEFIDHYRSKGWTILNKAKPGGLGKDKFWTAKMVRTEAAKFQSIYDFRTKSPRAYAAASRLGILDKISSTLESRIIKWTRRKIFAEARKYSTRSEFMTKSPSARQAARRLGIYERVCSHMDQKQNPYGYWTRKRIREVAKQYKFLTDFLTSERAAVSASKKLGIYRSVVRHLKRTRSANNHWTRERVLRSANKFKFRSDFMKKDPLAYGAAHRLGILNEVCSHMEKKQAGFGKKISFQGKTFLSVAAMARSFGRNGHKVAARIRMGWSIEEALELKHRRRPTPGLQIKFRGNKYQSRSELARAFNVEVKFLEARLKNGWTLEEALGLTKRRNYMGPRKVKVGGDEFLSIDAAARSRGLKGPSVRARLKGGWTLEQALDYDPPPTRKIYGRKITVGSQTFPSISAAAKYFGLSSGAVDSRLRTGWTIEEALDLKIRPRSKSGRKIEIDGKIYSSLTQAAKDYGVKPAIANQRIKTYGWTLRQALGISPPPKKSR